MIVIYVTFVITCSHCDCSPLGPKNLVTSLSNELAIITIKTK